MKSLANTKSLKCQIIIIYDQAKNKYQGCEMFREQTLLPGSVPVQEMKQEVLKILYRFEMILVVSLFKDFEKSFAT